ncbi:hypothetical protein FC83_GL000239 [Agrilactobacillus composti DSM 18527 = JCM 14202]|uniref:HotDog ACOT-type domain-containing protein n=1 Tax=Agrilactobacillus composti DSM 18527 = JCM 14202 TaxID=1423734 RepID=X0PFS3_9LACO|nr:hotdog domain-containing protein [Agrilactobacillus composti]KRM32835.1 hypothetical protein FC83_GL000239 [Agrilactobacillus composti DSM 18527 = JCM 14202]GAF40643.1 hypothetical protein JCM14202_2549 [Agrilactobacillus composti DSM 18527 = JCM 14202]
MAFYQEKTGEFYVEANQLNHLNILHGGELFKHCDAAIGLLASRYAGSRVLTVAVKAFNFRKIALVGELICFNVTLLSTSKKTMTFYAEITARTFEGDSRVIGEAVFVFVAVNHDLETIKIKPFKPTDDGQIDYIHKIQNHFHLN